MEHWVAPRAQDDLDDIWLYVARESNSLDRATRWIETIHATFLSLSRYPYLGRNRDGDFGPDIRSFPVRDYIIIYLANADGVSILRVIHGKRDLDQFVFE